MSHLVPRRIDEAASAPRAGDPIPRIAPAAAVRGDASGAVVRLSREAQGYLTSSPGIAGLSAESRAAVPLSVNFLTPDAQRRETPIIDVTFEPVRRARDRVGPARIVSAETLQSENVTPVVWLRVPEPGGARVDASRADFDAAPPIGDGSWLATDPLADPSDAAASVSLRLESARRATHDSGHLHDAGNCGFCRRAVAAYR